MKTRLRTIWENLRASYWFLPTVISLVSMALSYVSLTFDTRTHSSILERYGWLYSGGPEGARAVLATIAGSIITVAGTTFSVTIAVLSMASSQFGPRLLRNFMRDRGNQTVLGLFMATFVYCLLVLRAVRGTDNNMYVPHLSVTIGVTLALVSLGALIFFIHHIAESIQMSNVILAVGSELDDAIRRLFPATVGKEAKGSVLPRGEAVPVQALETGYVQNVEETTLLETARHADAVLHLRARPGDYVIAGATLLEAWGGPHLRDEENALRECFVIGPKRTPDQDAEFAFLQLAELAVRALSPGINDPFTAINCIDRISGALCLLAKRSLPAACRTDREGRVRVIAQPYSYEQLVGAALAQIRENGAETRAVAAHLRKQIDVILSRVTNPDFRAALEREKDLLPDQPWTAIVNPHGERLA